MKEVYREEQHRSLKKAQHNAHGGLFQGRFPPQRGHARPPALHVDTAQNNADFAALGFAGASAATTPTALQPPRQASSSSSYQGSVSNYSETSPGRPAWSHYDGWQDSEAGPSAIPDGQQYEGSDYSSLNGSNQRSSEQGSSEGRTASAAPSVMHVPVSSNGRRPRRSPLQMDEKVRQEIAIMKRSVHLYFFSLV